MSLRSLLLLVSLAAVASPALAQQEGAEEQAQRLLEFVRRKVGVGAKTREVRNTQFILFGTAADPVSEHVSLPTARIRFALPLSAGVVFPLWIFESFP